LDLGWEDGEFDAGKEDGDVVTTALFPVNLGIPLGATVWPGDMIATVHHHDDDGSHEYMK
jgi:hypothetical protein